MVSTVGAYVLEVQIGAGGSGTVWRARRRGPVEQVVAVKRLGAGADAGEITRLRREAAILAELDHPHIVRVLEVVDDGDAIAIAMPFAPGGSLEALLARRGRLQPGEVVAVMAPIARAAASAHRRQLLHGDIKPANILFTSDGEPLLSDFGVARLFGRPVTARAGVAGTAEYLAPEVLDGRPPDPRTDIYALGVVCHEALAGEPPFRGPDPVATIHAADLGEHRRLAELPEVPPSLAQVVETAMARDPARRTDSAESFARALEAAVPRHQVMLPTVSAGAASSGVARAPRTRPFGPRPPRDNDTDHRPRRDIRWGRLGVYGGVAAVALVAGYFLGPFDDRSGGGSDRCPTLEKPVVPPGGQLVVGDVNGDGCDTYGVYASDRVGSNGTARDAMVLRIDVDGEAPRRFGFGVRGDVLFLGDWDCDGIATAGLYRPQTGQRLYYDSWPTAERDALEPAATVTGPANAQAMLREGTGDNCDTIDLG